MRLLLAAALLLALLALPAWSQAPPISGISAMPVPRVGTKVLLLRLSLRMDHIDQHYSTMTREGREFDLTEAEALLHQLRSRNLNTEQQRSVFKVEMRVQALRRQLKEWSR